MCFTFKINNKPTKKLVNHFFQDGASAGIQSLQTSVVTNSAKRHGTDIIYNIRESIENWQCSVNCNYALHTDRIVNSSLDNKSKFGKDLLLLSFGLAR